MLEALHDLVDRHAHRLRLGLVHPVEPVQVGQLWCRLQAVRPVEKPEVASQLCKTVLSLPIHTEMREDEIQYIIQQVNAFFESDGLQAGCE